MGSKRHLFCNRVRIGRLRSFKVDDFGTNRKRVYDFLLIRHCTVSEIRQPIGKKLPISYPSLIRRPRSLYSISNFALKQETRVMGLSSSEDPMILAWVVLAWYQTVTDRRTESNIANTVLFWRAVKIVFAAPDINLTTRKVHRTGSSAACSVNTVINFTIAQCRDE